MFCVASALINKITLRSCVGARHNMPPHMHLLTLKVVSESRVMWDVPILVFPGRSVLDFIIIIIIIIIIKHVAY